MSSYYVIESTVGADFEVHDRAIHAAETYAEAELVCEQAMRRLEDIPGAYAWVSHSSELHGLDDPYRLPAGAF